jgi:hypothetical protein
MRDLLLTLFHLAVITAKLCGPGGVRAVIAENQAATDRPAPGSQWRDRPDRRVAVLDRFTFRIPYQIAGATTVVLALAHTSRRPDYWARRAITP